MKLLIGIATEDAAMMHILTCNVLPHTLGNCKIQSIEVIKNTAQVAYVLTLGQNIKEVFYVIRYSRNRQNN